MSKATTPFLMVNPKSYLYGKKSLELALAVDKIAETAGFDIYFTCPYADLRMIAENTKHVIITAQNMDPLTPGRGMGAVLPESLAEAGARTVVLNHAENPKKIHDLYSCVCRAKELGLRTIVCADSVTEAKAVAVFDPDIILAEPTDLIGTGKTAGDDYITGTVEAIKSVNPSTKVMIGSGITTADDCYKVVVLGADGAGSTSGILKAPSPAKRVGEMVEAIRKAMADRK